jgi:hypothetical protein
MVALSSYSMQGSCSAAETKKKKKKQNFREMTQKALIKAMFPIIM